MILKLIFYFIFNIHFNTISVTCENEVKYIVTIDGIYREIESNIEWLFWNKIVEDEQDHIIFESMKTPI